MTKKHWCYSFHEENWPDEGTFDSRDDAIAAANSIALEDRLAPCTFYTGHQQPAEVPRLCGQGIADALSEQMDDTDSRLDIDVAHDWPELSAPQLVDLEDQAYAFICAWLRSARALPSWWIAVDVTSHSTGDLCLSTENANRVAVSDSGPSEREAPRFPQTTDSEEFHIKAKAFLAQVGDLAKRHNVLLSHEDHEGNFVVRDRAKQTDYTRSRHDEWLRQATIEDAPE